MSAYLFNNDCNPYFNGDVIAKNELNSIIHQLSVGQASKKHLIFNSKYTPADYAMESIAFYYGELAGKIDNPSHMAQEFMEGVMRPIGRLPNKYSLTNSQEYTHWLKKYFIPVLEKFNNVKKVLDKIFKGNAEDSYIVLDYVGGFNKYAKLKFFLENIFTDENENQLEITNTILEYHVTHESEVIGEVSQITFGLLT
ncbi:MAG: hypothetical protein AB8B68_01945 [Rickettsiaceae bacterium]